MYAVEQDPYCYPNTGILKNRADLRSQEEIEKFETFKLAQRADEPLPVGKLSYSHYRAIHRHFFQDVYAWAGKLRTVRMAKEGNAFCFPENIDREMRRLFLHLADDNFHRDLDARAFVRQAAHFLSELNAIHPFREGNGRTQNIFLGLIADQAGHPLDFDRLIPKRLLSAMINAFSGTETPLSETIFDLMRVRPVD